MAPRDPFGEVRSLLSEAPSASRWWALCALLERVGPDRYEAELSHYVTRGLQRWPDALRIAPLRWLRAGTLRAPAPWLEQARALILSPSVCEAVSPGARSRSARAADGLARLGALPQLEPVREVTITLGSVDLGLSAERWWDALAEAPAPSQVRSLTVHTAHDHFMPLPLGSQALQGAPWWLSHSAWTAGLEALNLRRCYVTGRSQEVLHEALSRPRFDALHTLRVGGDPPRALRFKPRALEVSAREGAPDEADWSQLRELCLGQVNHSDSAPIEAWWPVIAAAPQLDTLILEGAGLTRAQVEALVDAIGARSIHQVPHVAALGEAGAPLPVSQVTGLLTALGARPLQTLSLMMADPEAVRALEAWPGFGSLRALSLYAAPAGSSLANTTALERLTWVGLGFKLVSDLPASLREVVCTGRVCEADAERLSALPQLCKLDASRTNLGPEGVRALFAGPASRSLRALSFRGDRVGREGVEALIAADPPALRALWLDRERVSNALDAEAIAALAAWPGLARLRWLSLAREDLIAQTLLPLLSSPHLSGLRVLDLTGCRVGGAPLQALCANPALSNLRALNLCSARLRVGDVATLLSSKALLKLRVLGLDANERALSDKACDALLQRAPGALPSLEWVDLGACYSTRLEAEPKRRVSVAHATLGHGGLSEAWTLPAWWVGLDEVDLT